MPPNAREAMRGSPSPWKVFAIIAKQARERDRRLRLSVKERAEEVEDDIVVVAIERPCLPFKVKRVSRRGKKRERRVRITYLMLE